MILPYSTSSRCSFTAVASIVLARSTAVLQASEATGAAVVGWEPCAAVPVLGACCLTGDPLVAPAAAPAGRSSDQATAPTKTPPTSASTTSRPVSSSQRREGRDSGAGDDWAAELAWSRCCWRPET